MKSASRRVLGLMLAIGAPALAFACSEKRERAPLVQGGDFGGGPGVPDSCATPREGCECNDVGATVECGEEQSRSGDYVECSVGERTCLEDGAWGVCVGSHVTTKHAPLAPTRGTLALGTPAPCGSANACDPYCNVIVDTGAGLSGLPAGVCTNSSGAIVACGQGCGYGGPTGAAYAQLNSMWQKQPATCMMGMDACGYDQNCMGSTCGNWAFPCFEPTPAGCTATKKIDLELGPPCYSSPTYHIPVCNRGAERADAGVIRIGVYSTATPINTCVNSMPAPPAPDKGVATFTLSTMAGRFIDPGKCIDITPGNVDAGSTFTTGASGTFSARRAIALNYDASLAECNFCNDWNAYEPAIACSGCTGLECAQTCPATTLNGTIYDPGGTNPIPGVVVYVPNGTVAALTDGVACDTCSSLYSGTPIASAVTDYQGKFTLTNAPAGTSFPLVIQTGRWRRKVTVPSITACASATLSTGEDSQLPSNKTEGDIPKMAVVMGAGDHLECLLRKIGVEDSEFTASTGTGRIHLYTHNGLTFTGAKPGVTVTSGITPLYNLPAELDKYSAIIAPCDNNHVDYSAWGSLNTADLNYARPPAQTISATQQANMKAYVDKGGRLFSTHWMGFDFMNANYPAAVKFVFGSKVDADREAPDFPYTIDQTTTTGKLFADWANQVGSSPAGYGTVTFSSWRHLVESVNTPTIRLAYGDSTLAPINHAASSTKWGGPQVSMFMFDAPWGVPAANQCGRVVSAETHVSGSGSAAAFPTGCTTGAMNGQEEAFEFLVFNTTQCLGLVAPPPPASSLSTARFTRDYQANCPHGTQPEWEFFSWQTVIPMGTSIAFTAQTADLQAGLTAATAVGAGTSSATTATWTSDPKTINEHLLTDFPSNPQPSRAWLRITATLNPSGNVSPELQQWRQTFDCIPAE